MAYYANPNPVYQPAMRLISAISNAFPAVVTTTFNNQYVNGTIVRFDIPPACGMPLLNQQIAPITVISQTQFSVPIDTTSFGAFSIPSGPPSLNVAAQVVPVGEVSGTLAASTINVLNNPNFF
jgi:hypothetical protein